MIWASSSCSVAMGQILHESGAPAKIANTMLRLCGREKSALALNLTGYIISILVFFRRGLRHPHRPHPRNSPRRQTGPQHAGHGPRRRPHLHARLVIPTPGPVAVAGNMGADIGWFIVYGVLIALPASLIGGVLYGKFLGRKSPIFLTDEGARRRPCGAGLAKSDHPSGALGIAIIFLPIMLIFFANI